MGGGQRQPRALSQSPLHPHRLDIHYEAVAVVVCNVTGGPPAPPHVGLTMCWFPCLAFPLTPPRSRPLPLVRDNLNHVCASIGRAHDERQVGRSLPDDRPGDRDFAGRWAPFPMMDGGAAGRAAAAG